MFANSFRFGRNFDWTMRRIVILAGPFMQIVVILQKILGRKYDHSSEVQAHSE
jgi:hypothetical protein